MKTNVNPVVATVLIVIVLVAAVAFVYTRVVSSGDQHGAKIPEVVMKEYREKGPRPMPPVPMPGGGRLQAPSGAAGPGPGTPKGK